MKPTTPETDKDFEQWQHEQRMKYFALKISPEKEEQLRELYFKEDSEYMFKVLSDLCNSERSEVFQKIPKANTAAIIFFHSLTCPELSIAKLCYHFGISQGYFRDLRLINKKEWTEIYLELKEEKFQSYIIEANDKQIPNDKWKADNDDDDRTKWII
ncbi:MAG: hypothetical protein Q7J35_14215 [Candidatus Methanoperedens sp.]|nr:hypothetical protein [Candidatus Methanoperedens sp.]